MAATTGGIDPHRDTFTVGVVDEHGVEIAVASFGNCGLGYGDAIDLLTRHGVSRVGVEGSGLWGRHVAIALVMAGFDVREVPAQRTASRRRARRQPKTDRVDAVATARALLAEPTLGPAQLFELNDPVVAEIEAVLDHRRALLAVRMQFLAAVGDQLAKLPTEIRDQLGTSGKIEERLRRLATIDHTVSSAAATYRLSWLLEHIEVDRQQQHQLRAIGRTLDALLDQHGTSLRDEPGIGTIGAATLLVEVGNPTRFSSEAKFARWCGTGAVALSSGEGSGQPVSHRVDWKGNRRINSILYIASVTQQRDLPEARAFLNRKISEGKTRRVARRAHKRHLANRVIRRMWKDHQRLHPQAAAATT